MEINEEILSRHLLFNQPIKYSENITLYPVKMQDILEFQQYIISITIRKDSIFPVKNIIKMSYLEFLFYCTQHEELAIEYEIPYLPALYGLAIGLLTLVCKNQDVLYSNQEGLLVINGEEVTSEKFDDLRRIIIIQNDVDFNIDDFIHYDTEQELKKAQDYESRKNKEKYTIEDYIDSYMVAMKASEEDVKNITIRKFWRHIKRISKHESYNILQTASCSGMVTFKEPISYWMSSIEDGDKYSTVKIDEQNIKNKVGG